jgi:hypothetical protein
MWIPHSLSLTNEIDPPTDNKLDDDGGDGFHHFIVVDSCFVVDYH